MENKISEPTKNVFKGSKIQNLNTKIKENSQKEINSQDNLRREKFNKNTINKNSENNSQQQNNAVNNEKKVKQSDFKKENVKNQINKPSTNNVEEQTTDLVSNTPNKKPQIRRNQKGKNLFKVMFLGGVGEIGKNLMVLEYENEILIIDCGATFPSMDELPGIDLVVPDITYLVQNKHKIKGIVITHGHEDHIGALPYTLNEISCPIYGSRLSLALIQNKLREFPKIKPKLNTIKAGDVVKIGKFSVEFIKVSHSIAGSMALAITTPVGVMVHTGDFKIDFEPIDGVITDLNRFAELGKKGVLLLTCESTNVEREGSSMSESVVGKTLDGLFEKHQDSRIFVATFASNIHRLQQLLDLAEKYKRKVAFTGRSMINITETAYKIGELKFNRDNFIDLDKINNFPDKELLIISTGSQGEPMSALTRMVNGEFPKIKLGKNDCIIMSSSPIPGNEKSVYNIINKLYRLGCDIIYSSLADVHASGHACMEELKTIHALVKPKYFIPVHGEYRHLKLHKDLAVNMGMEERNVILADVGSVIEVSNRSIKTVGTVTAGKRLIDGLGIGDTESIVLKDRKQLSEDGLAIVLIGISRITGEITSGPEIISRGLVYTNEDNVITEAKDIIKGTVKAIPLKEMNWTLVKNNIKKDLTNYLYKKTKRRPIIITIVMESA